MSKELLPDSLEKTNMRIPEGSLISPPLWLSTQILNAIIEETSGERSRNHFRRLQMMEGYAPSPKYHEITDYIKKEAEFYGLEDVRTEKFSSDGLHYYGSFLTEPGWIARKGSIWQLTPRRQRLADFSITPCALARYSKSTEVTADLVYVGEGTASENYQGMDVRDKIVLASGIIGDVHAEAVFKHGALGVLSFRTHDRFDHPDIVAGGQLIPWNGPNGESSTFGFSISYRQGQNLLNDLKSGSVRIQVEVDADIIPGEYLVVTGVISGREKSGYEVLMSAHSDHRNTGGNNSTGVGVSLEVVRTLLHLIKTGVLPVPRRNIRFMWGPEHKGYVAYVNTHPEVFKQWLYVINIDMAGKSQKDVGARFHYFRSPYSNPTTIDDAMQEILEWACIGNRHTKLSRTVRFWHDAKFVWPIVDPQGSRDDFIADVLPFWGPSDNEDLNAGSLKVHSGYFNDFPDPYMGSHQDAPETADPTQMKRACVVAALSLWAIADASPKDIEKLAMIGFTRSLERMSSELRKGAIIILGADRLNLPRKALEAKIALKVAIDVEKRSFEALKVWVEDDKSVIETIEHFKEQLISDGEKMVEAISYFHNIKAKSFNTTAVLAERTSEEGKLQKKVPIRVKHPIGPINLIRYEYGQAWLAEKLGNWDFLNLAIAKDGYFVHYETLNFVDGEKDLLQIRDAVSAEFGPVPPEHISEFFETMKKAGVIKFKRE